MGNASSSGAPRPLPEGVRKINDSLYQLYSPAEGAPEMDIIFFHGLQVSDYADAYWTTWFNEEQKILWPQTMLSKVFPRARILSVSYDSSAKTSITGGRMKPVTIGEALLRDIVESKGPDVGKIRPLVLVGHSLGGLIIKELLMIAHSRMTRYDSAMFADEIQVIKSFLGNVRGIFYYATPHGGSTLANIADRIPGSSPVLKLLKAFNAETERLNQDFIEWRKIHKIPACTLYETEKTGYWGVNAVIVTEASARRDSDKFYPANANHISICKPPDMISSTFVLLEEFIHARTLTKIGTQEKSPNDEVSQETGDDDMT